MTTQKKREKKESKTKRQIRKQARIFTKKQDIARTNKTLEVKNRQLSNLVKNLHAQLQVKKVVNDKYIGYVKSKYEVQLYQNVNVVGVFYVPQPTILYPKQFTWTNVDNHIYYPNLKGNFINAVQNQHSPVYCGSCWIINSLDVYATYINIYNRNHGYNRPAVQYSTQEVLNWFVKHMKKTCTTGGSPYEVAMYLLAFNLNYESNNTYVATSNPDNYDRTHYGSPFKCAKWGQKILTSKVDQNLQNIHPSLGVECVSMRPYEDNRADGFIFLYKYNEQLVKQLIYLNGSITTVVASDYIANYQGGIVGHDVISNISETKTDHLISIVGWGETADNVKFWICKNSWGQYWGEDGFFRIVANRNYLGIESIMTQMVYYDNNFKYAELFNLEKGPINKQFYKDAQFNAKYTTLKKFI